MTPIPFARVLLPLTGAITLASHLSAAPAPDPPRYEITDLGWLDPGYRISQPTALNAAGDVVGNSFVLVPCSPPASPPATCSFVESSAFLYTAADGMQGIVPLSRRNVANGINFAGDVVGGRTPETRISPLTAFRYTRSDAVAADLPGVAANAEALAINDGGQIVGYTGSNNRFGGSTRAFLWSSDDFVDIHAALPAGTSTSVAAAINVAGTTVGWYWGSGGGNRGFVRNASGAVTDLPVADGVQSQALAVSNAGHVAGIATDPITGVTSAALWTGGQMRSLGTLGGAPESAALGVNAESEVVGYSTTNETVCPGGAFCTWVVHAFLYRDGTLHDLNDLVAPGSGYVLENATAINDAGQIVATATEAGGGTSALLLTPIRTPAGRIEALIETVRGLGLKNGGIENSFVVKLEHALAALAAGNVGTACAELQAFVNHAEAQSGKKLTVAQASEIIAAAEAIRAALGCS